MGFVIATSYRQTYENLLLNYPTSLHPSFFNNDASGGGANGGAGSSAGGDNGDSGGDGGSGGGVVSGSGGNDGDGRPGRGTKLARTAFLNTYQAAVEERDREAEPEPHTRQDPYPTTP